MTDAIKYRKNALSRNVKESAWNSDPVSTSEIESTSTLVTSRKSPFLHVYQVCRHTSTLS